MRVCRLAAVVVCAMGMALLVSPSGAGADDGLPPLVTTLQTVLDGVGDVLDTVTSNLLDEPGADVTEASVEYAPGWIRMKVRLKSPIDPVRGPRWSDHNYVEWSFDTNDDGNVDYTVEFATEDGELYGAVFDVKKPDDPSLCDADSASFSAADGYTLVIDPKCVGKPRTLGYAVAMFLDTNADDEDAPVVADRVPDRGLRRVVAPVQPGEAPPAAPIAPTAAPGPPAGAPGPPAANQAAPTATPAAPTAAPGAPVVRPGAPTAPTARPGASTAAPPAAGGRPADSSQPAAGAGWKRVSEVPDPRVPAASGEFPVASAPAVSVPPAGAADTPPSLARTGAASERNSLLGLGLVLLGVGMLVMTRPKRPAHQLA